MEVRKCGCEDNEYGNTCAKTDDEVILKAYYVQIGRDTFFKNSFFFLINEHYVTNFLKIMGLFRRGIPFQ